MNRLMERSLDDIFSPLTRMPNYFGEMWTDAERMLNQVRSYTGASPMGLEKLVTEDGKSTMTIAMPHVNEGDIDIAYKKGKLIVHTKREIEKSFGNYTGKNTYQGMLTLPLPETATKEDITATYNNGRLILTYPAMPEVTPEKDEPVELPIH